jgi:hypothetical protein
MHTQRTKAVIARQLSQQELSNYFFPRSYPLWAWVMVVVSPILIGIGLISQLWLMSIAGLAIFLGSLLSLLSIKRGNPDDRLYDAWVENQGQLLAQKGLHMLDITRAQMSDRMLNMRSYVLPGSFDAADYGQEAVHMKRGNDGEWRFSINVYTYIYPLKDALAIFKGDINALDPAFHNDQDEIYSYRSLAGACTMSQPGDKLLMGAQKFPYRIEQFGLKFNNGETIKLSAAVKARPPGSMSGTPTIMLPDTGFNRTFNILRRLLLSKQIM